MPESEPAAIWRDIGELARVVGAYCWVEDRIFEIAGSWAGRPTDAGDDDPALRVWAAAAARRHGELARAWAERLPVRAGVDREALVAAPDTALEAAFARLAAERDGLALLTTLVEELLPRLGAAYRAHLATASPVSEGPVVEVLVRAERQVAAEIEDGGRVLAAHLGSPARNDGMGRELGSAFERSFDTAGVFPAVRPS